MIGRGCAGRGERLRELLEQMEKDEKQQKMGAETPPPPKPEIITVGRGRGIIHTHQPEPSFQGRTLGRGLSLLAASDIAGPSSVQNLEQSLKSTSLQPRAKPMSKPDPEPVIHHGTSGQPMDMTANYIRLNCDPGKGMFEYFVRFTPDIDNVRLKYDLISSKKDVIGETRTFDGQTLYLPHQLKEEVTFLSAVSKFDNSPVQIEIIYQRQRNLGECVHFYNVLFKRIMGMLNFIRFGRNNFNPKEAVAIPEYNLEVWPGYVTAIDNNEGGLLLCCDVSSRVLRKVTAYQIIQDCITSNRENWQEMVSAAIIGSSVMTDYNKKLYRVDDIDYDRHPDSTFKKNGEDVSFTDYYKKSYNVHIRDRRQPLLIHREKKSKQMEGDQCDRLICLVPELCYLTGLTEEMRSDYKVMKSLNAVTSLSPNIRQLKLKQFIDSVNDNSEIRGLLQRWGLTLEKNSIELKGRKMAPERIIFGNMDPARANSSEIADWKRDTSSRNMLTVVDLRNWVVVCTKRDGFLVEGYIKTMRNVAPKMGMEVADPYVKTVETEKPQAFVDLLRRVIQPDTQIVVIVFPTRREDRYSAVKKICLLEKPVPSQVIIANKLKGPKASSIIQKIALQMNCKLGGTLWRVDMPCKETMICGLDSYHDPSGRGCSWVGFVASTNAHVTKWYSQVIEQKPHQEIVDILQPALTNALMAYQAEIGCFPKKLVIFRDGVGDGQLKTCQEHEIPQLLGALQTVTTDYVPKIAYIIVQKRINTRLLTVAQANRGFEYGNPLPGSVMDNTVTRRLYYDFFIVSQHVTQGTVAPTHYIVLFDSIQWKPDQLQKLTYKMCHLYYNWPGTVRIPAPCQYAHKLAYLVGQCVRTKPDRSMNDRLYYL